MKGLSLHWSGANVLAPTTGRNAIPYVLVVGIIATLVIGLASVAFLQEKARYRERATIATRNVSRLLDRHISDVFDKIDLVLQSVAFGYREQTAQGRLNPLKFNALLAQQEALLPEVLSLRVADAQGLVRFGKGIPPDRPVDLSDRDYFVRARDDPNANLLISGPIFARISQRWVIVFARRLTESDGAFGGVVYANLSTTHFEQVFSSVELGPRGAATIRTADLALVHRYPETKNAVGSKDVSSQLREIVQAQPLGSDYIAATALDGIERSNAYRKLDRYPFYVIVGLATDDYLGGWKRNVLLLSGLASLAILATCLAAMFVYRATRRLAADIEERKLAARLQHENARRLARLTAHLASVREEQSRTIAREVHDELGGTLTMLKLSLALLKDSPADPGSMPARCDAMIEQADSAIQAVKRISASLRPAMLDSLGLCATIQWHANEFARKTGIRSDVQIPEAIDLPVERSIAVYRIIQEALTNVVRHAAATAVHISMRIQNGHLIVVIRDNGRGLDDHSLHKSDSFGIVGMRERAQYLGGQLVISGTPGEGTALRLRLPLDPGPTLN